MLCWVTFVYTLVIPVILFMPEKQDLPGKRQDMKTQTGIWLDSNKAYIIQLQEGAEASLESIESGVEHYNIHGGYGGKDKFLAQDARSERGLMQRKKQQMKRYFETIIEKVQSSEELLIFGPAEAKTGLEKVLAERKDLNKQKRTIETADSMTQNQMVDRVKRFFAPG